jgi:4-hydroxy-tetrahydrodipicolinate synthase
MVLPEQARRRLCGAHAGLITPFTETGELDIPSLESLCEWQLANGTNGLSIGGSTGEPGTQSVDERIRAMRTVAAYRGSSVPFLAGTGSLKLDETMALTRAAAELGADAALVVTPYYAVPTQSALYEWYARLAREFPSMPIIIYNVPARTAVEIAPETVQRLASDFDNIIGIKETTRDFQHFSRVGHLCGPEFLMWSGIELLCLPLLVLGGSGFISALSNIAPRAVSDMYRHYTHGDLDAARQLHYDLHPLADLLFVETNPAPAKWLLRRLGVIASDNVRPPLTLPAADSIDRIKDLLEQAKALIPPALI